MLMETSDSLDPEFFRESELFKKCQEMGVVPLSEKDLVAAVKKPETDQGVQSEGLLGLNLRVNNMWCPACAWVIEEALKRDRGVLEASCHFSTDRLHCHYNPVLISPDRII